jgi:CheY-like chemotaxis protein
MACILVIDENPELRLSLAKVLRGGGHAVVEAADGAEGLHALDRDRFDLILCDLFMPEKDGMEVIRELRQHRLGIRIIAMSGGSYDGRLDVLPVAERLGAAALRKPFTARALLDLVGGALLPEGQTPPACAKL